MSVSGLVLQLGFHFGGGGRQRHFNRAAHAVVGEIEKPQCIDSFKTVWGISYTGWSSIHKFAIALFLIFMVYHIFVHWNWYNGVFKKRLIGKNKQVIILSGIFILVAITGLIPWFIDSTFSDYALRKAFIEIHDKIALVFVVFLILHTFKRATWFYKAYLGMTK